MCRQMEIPYERFPKDIRKLHDAISANYRVRQDKIRSQAFDQKCAEYKEVGITSDQYFIRFPHDFAELIMEGSNISPDELSGVLQMPLVGVIPECREITNVNNGGNSVFYGNTKSTDKQKSFAGAVRSVAKRMLELDEGDNIARTGFEENKGRGFFSSLFRHK